MNKTLNLLIFRDCEWWVAQCLEYDIAVQARTLKDVQYEFQRILFGRIATAKKLGIEPFEDIPAAPKAFQNIFEDKNKTFRVELKPTKDFTVNFPASLTLSKEASLYAV